MSLQKRIIVGTSVYLVLLLALFSFVNDFLFIAGSSTGLTSLG